MVSVIIPTYNRSKTIRRAIESVLTQTYNQLELIIVDDGSTDNTDQWIKEIQDERLRYIKLPYNMGACHARNVGIEEAKGSYIAFQDSDDVWHHDKLEKQLNTMNRTGADVTVCRYDRYTEDGNTFVKTYPSNIEPGFCTIKQVVGRSLFGTPTLLARAGVLKLNLFDESLPRLQDFELVLRLIQSYSIYFMNEVLVDAYFQKDSVSQDRKNLIKAEEIILSKHGSIIEQYNEKARHLRGLIVAKTMEYIPCDKECETLLQTSKSIKNLIICALQKMNLLRFCYKYYN